MDIKYCISLIPEFIKKFPYTLEMILIGFIFGTLLAVVITIVRIRKIPVLAPVLEVYVSFIRCIPSVLLLYLIYYGTPVFFQKYLNINLYNFNKLFFACISLVLFNGGHISEIFRAAYNSLDGDQIKLSKSMGYSSFETVYHVIAPQVLKIAIPDLGNAAQNIMKDSALFYTIGIIDIMGLANIFVGNNFGIRQTEIYVGVALVYWFCSILIIRLTAFFQKTFDKGELKDA